MDTNKAFRQRIEEHQSKLDEEKEWWDRKKARIQEGFMKELEEEGSKKSGTVKSSATAGQSTDTSATASSVTTGSDDDAVLVEADGSVGTNSTKKKKKGKK
jgi:translocation protein SEC66